MTRFVPSVDGTCSEYPPFKQNKARTVEKGIQKLSVSESYSSGKSLIVLCCSSFLSFVLILKKVFWLLVSPQTLDKE